MYSASIYTGDSVTTDFAIPFPYIDRSHIEVSVAGASVGFTFVTSGLIRCDATPATGAEVIVRRNSNRSARLVDFTDSAVLTESILDRDSNQLMFLVQECFDQVSTQSYFTTDAEGSRVLNVADPVADTDAATKGWVQAYLDGVGLPGTDGLDIRPLTNTGASAFSGRNAFTGLVDFGGATWDSTTGAARGLLFLTGRGLLVSNTTTDAEDTGFGFVSEVSRSSGFAAIIGAQFSAFGRSTWAGSILGFGGGAWRTKSSTGDSRGAEAGVVNTNAGDSVSRRVGLDVTFYNREVGQAQGGSSPTTLTQTGDGTGSNFYNANSIGMRVWGQGRSDAGATYVGWNRGIAFGEDSLDIAKVQAYNGATAYKGGDYVTSGGKVWLAKRAVTGVAPVAGDDWADYGAGSTVDAVGIDFAGVGPTTAARMRGAIRLRGNLPILWDTEGVTKTYFNPDTGIFHLDYVTTEVFGVNAANGDIRVVGQPRVLATQSSVKASPASPVAITAGYTQMPLGSVSRDNRGEFSTGTMRFVPNTPGMYLISAQVQTEATSSSGRLAAVVRRNGVTFATGSVTCAAGINTAQCVTPVYLNGTGDYVTLDAYWDGLSGVTLTSEAAATYLTASKLA